MNTRGDGHILLLFKSCVAPLWRRNLPQDATRLLLDDERDLAEKICPKYLRNTGMQPANVLLAIFANLNGYQ